MVGLRHRVCELDEIYEVKSAEKAKLLNTIKLETDENKKVLSELKKECERLTKCLLVVQDNIKSVEMDIEDAKEEYKNCQQRIVHAHRETERMDVEKLQKCER